jgi:UDP-N-acetylglucosamine--N-acetylmuramyl-(pentapeptide) pyrophosphoryl-undecaprenol N-acetylglucosamine transferase
VNGKTLHIVVACGGTGGHVFPGLATARELRQRGHEVDIWLSGRAIENDTLAGWTGVVFRTGARPLSLATVPAFATALWRGWRRLRAERPDRLLAMGSYASIPPVLAARARHIPIILHEANAVPGKAVDRLSRLATATAVSFPGTERFLPRRRVVMTGLPVRVELAGAPRLDGFDGRGFTVLVTGGSQGAHRVNELTCEAFCALRAAGMDDLRVIHQSGAADEAVLRARYAAAGVDARVTAFLREMGQAYASADLAICRAGAATCAELCLCGVPALLIPLPTAVRDHQRLNAEAMVRAGGAELRLQADLTAAALAETIRGLRADAAGRARMRASQLTLAAPGAAARLADLVENPTAGR